MDKALSLHETVYAILKWLPIASLRNTTSVCWLWNTVTLKLLAERRRSSASFKFSVRFDTTTTNDYKSSCLLDALNRDKRLFEETSMLPLGAIFVISSRKILQNDLISWNLPDHIQFVGLKTQQQEQIVYRPAPCSAGIEESVALPLLKYSADQLANDGLVPFNINRLQNIVQQPSYRSWVDESKQKPFIRLLISHHSLLSVKPMIEFDEKVFSLPNLKAIVLLSLPRQVETVCSLQARFPEVVIAGAPCQRVITKNSQLCAGFTISGNVRVGSVVFKHMPLPDSCEFTYTKLHEDGTSTIVRGLEEVDRQLDRLQASGLGKGKCNSFAFVFPCCSRYHLENSSCKVLSVIMGEYEFKPFHERFPNTPLLGFYGTRCEFGYESYPQEEGERPTKRRSEWREMVHGGSTVILFIEVQ